MAERIQRQHRRSVESETDVTTDVPAPIVDQVASLDALLDEIDEVLTTDAESYVKGFVQKGGQ